MIWAERFESLRRIRAERKLRAASRVPLPSTAPNHHEILSRTDRPSPAHVATLRCTAPVLKDVGQLCRQSRLQTQSQARQHS